MPKLPAEWKTLPRCGLALALSGMGFLLAGDRIALIGPDAPWRYHVARTPPSDPVEAWRQADFDDRGWLTGAGPFGDPSQGAFEMNVPLSSGAGPWITVCFRREFVVEDPAGVVWLVFRAEYEDGLVVYLNGSEVARRSMPEGVALVLDSPAVSAGRKPAEAILLDTAATGPSAGTNVLAVEVHKTSTNDLSVAFQAELLANFIRGPVVQNLSSNEVTITWRTPVPATSELRYWIEGGAEAAVTETNEIADHVLRVIGLSADTTYRYVVVSSSGGREAVSPESGFRTLKTEGPVEILLVGDTGTGAGAQRSVRDRLAQEPGDLVLHVGDVVYPAYLDALADFHHFSVFREELSRRPMFTVFGNHDLAYGDADYLANLVLPTNVLSGTEHYYSFDHGEVHFVALLLTQRAQAAAWPALTMEEGSPQYRWLTNDLATTLKPWRVVFGHVPLTSSGGRRFDGYLGLRDQAEYQRILLPVFERHGVQLYLAGHDHVYERTGPLQGTGIHQIVSGGGGYSLYGLTERDAATAVFRSVHHVVRLRADAVQLEAEAVDVAGQVFDRFVIRRTPIVDTAMTGIWHTPHLAREVDDGDGNVAGETFDFPDQGWPAVSGRAANLGWLHVALDAEWLNLGLRGLMLPGSQSVFLFLGVEAQGGAASLAGMGNGVVDPIGQGVDGLDALGGVDFVGFQPLMACLLGDEYADGTFRSFVRSESGLDPGQGAFWLEPGFPAVDGVQLRQFGESPQGPPVREEQRADFVVLRIPRSALPSAVGGAAVQIGVVAGHTGADLEGGELVARLDSGFWGESWEETAPGRWLLRPLAVRLPEEPELPFALRLERSSESTVDLVWYSIPGAMYALEVADTLGSGFLAGEQEGFPMTASGRVARATLPFVGTTRYFRLRLVLP